jgi:DNA-binding beta-propeller fold protein YncE
VIRGIGVGEAPSSISADGTHVWVASPLGMVTEINAATGLRVRSIAGPPGLEQISSDGAHVWVTQMLGLVFEISASTGRPVTALELGLVSPAGISSDGTHVWVTETGMFGPTSAVAEIRIPSPVRRHPV